MFRALKSLIAGVIAGTALGVLFSPKKGTDLRNEFKKEIKSGGTGLGTVKSTLTHMGRDVKDTVSESQTYKKTLDKAEKYLDENLTSRQKKQAKRVIKKAGTVAKKAKAKARKTVNEVAKKIVNKTS